MEAETFRMQLYKITTMFLGFQYLCFPILSHTQMVSDKIHTQIKLALEYLDGIR